MFDDEDLLALTREQRRALAARLAQIDGILPGLGVDSRRRRIAMTVFGGGGVLMLVWIVLLTMTLPDHYHARAWRVAWVGFDLGLLALLAVLAWAAWRRRHILLPALIVTGTLLSCDAWFDTALSWGGGEQWISILTALAGEIPLAAVMLLLARKMIIRMATAAGQAVGIDTIPTALHRIPLFLDTPHLTAGPGSIGGTEEL